MRAAVILSMIMYSGCASSHTAAGRPTTDERVRIVGSGGSIQLSILPTVAARVDTVLSPLDQVWRVLPAVYDSLAIPVASLDAANHVIGNPGMMVRRRLGNVPLTRYLECGSAQGAPSAETYEIRLSVLTRAYAGADGSTTVTTTIEATGRPVTFAGEYARCSSTGALESRLVSTLKAQLPR